LTFKNKGIKISVAALDNHWSRQCVVVSTKEEEIRKKCLPTNLSVRSEREITGQVRVTKCIVGEYGR
jgi:hypothetical protein